MSDNLEKLLTDYKDETRQHFDQKTEETKRHFDIVAEDIQGSIKAVAEQVGANTEKLTAHDQRFDKQDQELESIKVKLVTHDQRFDTIEETLDTVKMDIQFIKNGIKKKVDQDEFTVLERRVSLLESRVKTP